MAWHNDNGGLFNGKGGISGVARGGTGTSVKSGRAVAAVWPPSHTITATITAATAAITARLTRVADGPVP